MKSLFIIGLVCLFSTLGNAQTLTNTNGTIYVGPGATLYVGGGISNQDSLVNQGTINTNGNISNTGTWTGSGALQLTGGLSQTVNMGSSPVYSMDVNKGSSSVILNDDLTVSGFIDLTGSNNFIFLGNHQLNLLHGASITGYGSSSYIVTNGSGMLVYENLDTQAFVYPIGRSSSSQYTPVTLSNSGVADDMGARVMDSAYSSYSSGNGVGAALTGGTEVQKTWVIHEGDSGGSNLNMTVQWNTGNEGGSFNRAWSSIGYFNQGVWQPNTAFSSAGGSNPFTLSRNNININLVNTPFGVGGQNSPLPLRFIKVQSQWEGKDALILWEVMQENDVQHYVVEKSADGVHWTSISSDIECQRKNATQYVYKDEHFQGESKSWYYRIKAEDDHGQTLYSHLTSLNRLQISAMILFPNPSNETVCLMGDGEGEIDMIDMNGRVIKQAFKNSRMASFDIRDFPSGIYTLRLRMSGGEIYHQQWVVQH